ncbi:YceI family protein [Tabrizicola sp.]|uniref:YceI family protein n=1 Tax=Tabrizicola sp. TaxID=2005166 RepID=UPI001A4DEC63|nr:YceI family protein [Tabrizicola sp.]MBL9074098.1 YceI family protein [Tabrizicola sp.]
MRRLAVLFLATLFPLQGASAATTAYHLDPVDSTVAFETDFGPDLITGSIPLEKADLKLDFDNVANCTVAVALDVTGAKASFPFAAQALKGPKVLDAKGHPRMTFDSTSVKRAGEAADVTGNLTIRGVTKAVTLHAQIFRPKGSTAGDLDHLTVKLTGKVNRSDFGATGWSDMVGDEVRIIITARIDAAG